MKNPTAFTRRNGYRGKGPTTDATANNQPLVRTAANETGFFQFTADRALISDPSGGMTQSSVTSSELAYLAGLTGNVQTQLDEKAPLDSPAFTGNPTAPTQTAGNNSTRVATTAYCDTAVGTRLATASNLSDLANAGTARSNLGLGSLAVLSTITKSYISDLETIATSSTANALVKANGSGTIADDWLSSLVDPLRSITLGTSAANKVLTANSTGFVGIGISPTTGHRLTTTSLNVTIQTLLQGPFDVGDTSTDSTHIAGGMYFARNGANEPFLRFRSGGGSTLGSQFRGLVGGGFRFTNDDGSVEWFRITSSGIDVSADTWRLRTSRTPASASATGNSGDWCWDTSFIYVCTATNTWKRAALSTW